jgi:DNA (cytosine-5)-methyltransferase 1
MVDLFAGIGGFRIAAERCGGRCVAFSEIDSDAIWAYTTNHGEDADSNLGDIKKLSDLPPHDLLTGGVPCQSWSIAGRNMGFDDDRGQLGNDALYLLNRARPKAFIFETVKGLADPRNGDALAYIMGRIREAGYHGGFHVIDSSDYGVPQSRVRIYVVGFADEEHHRRFTLPAKTAEGLRLADVLEGYRAEDGAGSGQGRDLGGDPANVAPAGAPAPSEGPTLDLFGKPVPPSQARMSLSANNNGHNDYFLFNDLRNGETTVHSWEILETTERQRRVCMLLLKNRRKARYGFLDGNPLSLAHFRELDESITQDDIDGLVEIGILKPERYSFTVRDDARARLTDDESQLLSMQTDGRIIPDSFASGREWKAKRLKCAPLLDSLSEKGVIACDDVRYDFRNTKISTGLFGVNRVFLPQSAIFPTLVASDSNDYVTTVDIEARCARSYKDEFIERVYKAGRYRRITKTEALRIQGFPDDFELPEARARWMKLIGNSVAVSLVEQLVRSVCDTGVFAEA